MPRHFSKMMFSPYFQSDHFQNESASAKIERKIEYRVKKILSKFGLVRNIEDELQRVRKQFEENQKS